MNQQNQEIIIRCIGVLQGLTFAVPEHLKPALELLIESLSFVLDSEGAPTE